MAEHTPERVADLIAEARSRTYTPSRPATLIARLADALEAMGAERDKMRHELRLGAAILRDAADEWEATGDDEKLVNDTIDPWITRVARILSRIPEHPKED